MVAMSDTQARQLDPELALAVRELKRNYHFQTFIEHQRKRREDMISEMALPVVLDNHAFLAAIAGRVDEVNYLLDLLTLAGGDDESELDKP